MEQKNSKPAIDFQPNTPVPFKLRYNHPKTGNATGKDGSTFVYYLYGAVINGIDETFFASPLLHKKIQQAKMVQNSEGVITLTATIGKDGKAYKDYKLEVGGQEIILQNTQEQSNNQQINSNSQSSNLEIIGLLREIKSDIDNKMTIILGEINEMNNKKINDNITNPFQFNQ